MAPMEQRYHPQIRARAGLFNKISLGDHKEGPDLEWSRFQRVQLDSMELDGGHGFGDWWEKYSKTNPDFFALQPDGTRSPKDQWLAEVDEQLRENPTLRVFNTSENDGYGFGHCVCKECQAKDRPEAEKFPFR